MCVKIVSHRLVDPVGESPNIFGKLDWALRNYWLKIFKKNWHVGDRKGLLGKSVITFGE